MQKAIRIAAVVAAVALIVVIGWIIKLNGSKQVPVQEATAEPTAAAETTPTPEPEQTGEPDHEAQDDAQGTMYEGALAGLTEEEIAALALAEEHSAAQTENVGAEDAVD